MRTRAKYLQKAHNMLLDWANWIHTHQGQNGVMGQLVGNYTPHRSDTPPHCLVPRIDMPKNISIVDIEYRDAPDKHMETIEIKYLLLKKVSRHAEDRMLEYMAGRLTGKT